MTDVDVLVVGAGLAGLEVCRSLAAMGRSVLLVDAKSSLTERVHTTGIFVRRTLEDFQFPSQSLGPVVRDVSLYSPNGKQIDLSSPHDEFRVGKMGFLYTQRLAQCRALGVKIHLETRFDSAVETQHGTNVRLQHSGNIFHVRTRFFVGADGAQSRVARQLQLSENKRWIVGLERVYEGSGEGAVLPRFHCLLDPVLAPGYLAWFVNDGEEVHIGVGGNPQKFDPVEALSKFEEWVNQHISDRTGRLIEKRGGLIPVGGVLPHIVNSKGLLVGDAAGAVSPLTAGGLDPCLRLSRTAAVVIDEYLDSNRSELLNIYAGAKLRKKFWKRLLLRNVLESCRWRNLINIGWNLLDTPPGRAFAKKVMFGRGSFPDVELPKQETRHQKTLTMASHLEQVST